MTSSAGTSRPGLSRRALLAASASSVVAAGAGVRSVRAAPGIPILKVGYLPFGAVQWEIDTLVNNGFDKSAGFQVEMVPLASSEAARIAFLAQAVDTMVQDLLFAARLKADGKSVLFLPQSSTEGELVAANNSPIKSIADLKGKSIGVAGGPVDKNWLFLRAAALEHHKLDLTRDASPVFGAPPLLATKVERGELDCGMLYWSTAARLKPKGYREVTTTGQILASLGARGKVAVGGYLFRGGVDQRVLAGFAKALRMTEHLLATSPEAWTEIRPVMKAPDDATFESLKNAYLDGIPQKPREEEIADARSFFAVVLRVGGSALVGPARDIPDDLYVDRAIYG